MFSKIYSNFNKNWCIKYVTRKSRLYTSKCKCTI